MKLLLGFLVFLCLAGCTSNQSPQQMMATDRQLVYKDTYKAYMEAENKYLNLLFNIERLPEEQELWIMKRDQMKELIQLRELMLLSRTELDAAIQDWEKYLIELEKDQKKLEFKSPNLRGQDANRSSPGELLQNEAYKPPPLYGD